MLRKILTVVLLLGLLGGVARAQDEQRAQQFLQAFQQVFDQNNMEPAIKLIVDRSEDAVVAAHWLASQYDEMTPANQQGAVALINLIARVLDLRKGDKRLTQELEAHGVLMPEDAWEGTALARGSNDSGPGGPMWLPEGAAGTQSQRDVALVATLLRLGDYQGALALDQALATEHPEEAAKLVRYGMASVIGLGVPNTTIPMLEQAIGKFTDPEDQLAYELMVTYAAVDSAMPAKAREHLAKASALAAKYPGAYGQVARFLTKSWAFQFELQANPRMPFSQIKQRHDDAWSELKSLSTEHRGELTSEMYWVADTFWEVWFEHVLVDVAKYNLESQSQLLPLIEADLGTLTKLMGDLGPEHLEGALSWMVVALKVIGAEQEVGGQELAEAAVYLKQINQQMPTLQNGVNQLYGVLETQNADLLKRLNIKLNPQGSAVTTLVGGMHLLNALQIMEENDDNALSPAQANTVRQELVLAEQATTQAFTMELAQEVTDAELDFLEKTRPPNWEADSEKMINDFLKQPYVQDLRSTQAKFYYRLGKLRSVQGRNAEAIADYQKAIDIFESYIREIGGGADSGNFIRFFGNVLYEAMAKAQLQQGKNNDAFSTIGRLQQVETAGVFQMNDLRNKLKPEDQALLTRAQQGKDEIEAQEKSLASLKASNAPVAQINHASQLLAQSRDSYYKTVTDLETKYPAFNRLDIKPINFSKLQRAIPPNTLVVLLFPTDDQLYLMEATNDNLLVRQVGIKRSELDDLAVDFRRQMVTFSRNPGPFDWKSPQAADLKKDLSQLYDTIVKPVETDMKGKDAIAFVPYGNLVYLPFQAFLTQNPDGSVEFLVEKKQVVVLSKAADLDQIYGPPSEKGGNLVAFGNPDGSLAGASQEVKALADIFPGSQVYLEAQATEDKLAAIRAPQVSYLHLATHGNLNAQDPRQSYLTMARGEKLSVSEITGYHLDSAGGDLNLVTLSACQTALADKAGAGDGSDLRSLADAFSFAGCRSMVASLWKVEDNATRDLMVEFYKNLKAGKSKAASLQAAQVSLLKQDKYAHPFFWAPFILIGDWR